VAEGAYTWEEAQKYLEARLDLAKACIDAEKNEEACRHYSALVQMDPEADHLQTKPIFLRALLDLGALENAKDFLDAHPAAAGSPDATLFAWSEALLEYVLWSVLDDDEGSEEKACAAWAKAYQANPHVATILAWHESFVEEVLGWQDMMEKLSQLATPSSPSPGPCGGIEEALLYAHQGGLEAWMDAEGALEWSTNNLGELDHEQREKVELNEGCCADEEWLELFEKAVEKGAAEASDGGEEGAGGTGGAEEDGDEDEGEAPELVKK